MPTVLSHIAIPLAAGLGLGRGLVSRRLMGAGMLASMLPDIDVVSFRLGIAYGADMGHRGLSHSLVFALAAGLIAMPAWRWLESTRKRVFLFVFMATASHGMLDIFTNGGHGVALLWPFSSHRFFAPLQPIQVSPIGLSRFISGQAWQVLGSELIWVWLPCALTCCLLWFHRVRRLAAQSGPPA